MKIMLFNVFQAAQQIIELQEAAQINAGLQPTNLGRNNSLHDMKTVVKTWRNRLPIVSDDLSHWSSIFMWRQHHYQGKTAWSSMHSSCNFPDNTLFEIISLRIYFFYLNILECCWLDKCLFLFNFHLNVSLSQVVISYALLSKILLGVQFHL